MFVEFCELTVYLIAGSKHHSALFQGVVDGIAAAVWHAAVSVRVACAPLHVIGVVEGVLSCQLRVVGRAAAIVVFCTNLVVRLCVDALSVSVSSVGKAVENVFQLILVVA